MARDQQILDAAEKLFFERGFDGVGVDEIGKLAGVTGSAIYRHFDSKDEILAMLFDQAVDGLMMRVGGPRDDPREELAALVRAHVDFAASHLRLAGIWSREQRSLSEPYQRRLHQRQRRYVDVWVDCLSRCYPARSQNEIVTAVRGVQLLLLSEALRPAGGRRTKNASDVLARIALAGLASLA